MDKTFYTTPQLTQRLLKIGFEPQEADMYYRDGQYYIGKFNPNTMAQCCPIWSVTNLLTTPLRNYMDFIEVAQGGREIDYDWFARYVPENNNDVHHIANSPTLAEAIVKILEMLYEEDRLWRDED